MGEPDSAEGLTVRTGVHEQFDGGCSERAESNEDSERGLWGSAQAGLHASGDGSFGYQAGSESKRFRSVGVEEDIFPGRDSTFSAPADVHASEHDSFHTGETRSLTFGIVAGGRCPSDHGNGRGQQHSR